MGRYALGLDYGTNSCRSLIIDLEDGREIGSAVFDYPHGEAGILLDPRDPNCARQHPQDYLDGAVSIVRGALAQARDTVPGFDPGDLVGLGVDTTGSTPIPVDRGGVPLAFQPGFAGDLNAMAWLWKDHTSHREAARITELAREMRPAYLASCGGVYSSEWYWSKILHCLHAAPEVFKAAHAFVECCDWIPAVLCGEPRPAHVRASVCAAGHKALYNPAWGGLPDAEFLAALDPALVPLRERRSAEAVPADRPAGRLCAEWAERLGLAPGLPVAVGAFDAHMGAVGAGIREGTLVKILGTSTCDLMVVRNTQRLADIPGVCGVVDGSVLPGYFGIEAGQSAVGDIFLWFVDRLVPEAYGRTREEKFEGLGRAAQALRPGEHGLLALDWNNGNRTVLVDPRLTGLLVGQTLHTQAHEIYRALIEATAFGAMTIMERIEAHGVPVREVVNCGGLAVRNPLLMQIYADITGRPMRIARSDQTCALGAAIFGAVAAGPEAGGFAEVADAQAAVSGVRDVVYTPVEAHREVYGELYRLYRKLHDAFGGVSGDGDLADAMKRLIELRERARLDAAPGAN